jgi:hypothetical protein
MTEPLLQIPALRLFCIDALSYIKNEIDAASNIRQNVSKRKEKVNDEKSKIKFPTNGLALFFLKAKTKMPR